MDQQAMELVRKRKRMQSNRESARRSRQRKQKHLDDLTAQAGQLKSQNRQIISTIDATVRLYHGLEAENTVLRAQLVELENRLQSLNDMVSYLTRGSNIRSIGSGSTSSCGSDRDGWDHLGFEFDGFSMDSWVGPTDGGCVMLPVVDDSFLFCA